MSHRGIFNKTHLLSFPQNQLKISQASNTWSIGLALSSSLSVTETCVQSYFLWAVKGETQAR